MMRKYLFTLLCLGLAVPGFSETIDNLEFHFPPSHYDWNLLFESENPLDEDEEFWDDDDGFWDDEDDEDFDGKVKVFTHREGDALELFFAMAIDSDEANLAETDFELKMMSLTFSKYFSNYNCTFTAHEKEGEFAFNWEISDQQVDLMHGLSRCIKANGKMYALLFFTTAEKSQESDNLWKNVLEQISFQS